MANGIDLILADHERVDALFTQFGETEDGGLVGLIVDALHAHDDAEQAALYPLATVLLGDAGLLERAAMAHSMVKRQIDLIAGLEGPPLIEAVLALRLIVSQHVADEEEHLLPALTEAATPQQLEGLGARILQAKQRVG